ncbi:hypothetical protein FHW69_003687 [Luteibacter sp. Sphag1AF]|uniref:reprolysin-like metallopeptidase n=1 Tax=Luteibacter sp. Sphag1AF TaxID=2587031 RepID=UPI00161CB59E|nr:hypothetical protein [Luteibacter sp. Sphag1AF]
MAAATLSLSFATWAAKPLVSPSPPSPLLNDSDPVAQQVDSWPSTRNMTRVEVNIAALSVKSSQVQLNLDPQQHLVADHRSSEVMADGTLVWIGHIRAGDRRRAAGQSLTLDDVANEVILVRNGNLLMGSVRVDGKPYAIQPMENGHHIVYSVDTSALPPEHPAGGTPVVIGRAPATTSEATTQATTIRVLFAFDRDAAHNDTEAGMTANLIVAQTNQGYANSGIEHRLELAGTRLVDYTGSGSLLDDLRALTNPNDGSIDDIHAARNATAADMVSMVVSRGDACGMGWLGGRESDAFTVVHNSCATSSYSAAHELGHNLSADHDISNAGGSLYAWGHGHTNPAAHARTVMAYDCPGGGCTRYNVWSSPANVINGAPAGVAGSSENVRVLNASAVRVAGYR